MLRKKEIFLHVGFPKTATTTLQNNLFCNLQDFDIIGQPFSRDNIEMQRIVQSITDCESMEYKHENVCGQFGPFLTDRSKLLISEEAFSTGSSLSGRVDRMEIAFRLAKLFPDAKILIVLREQKSIIKSVYLQRLKIDPNFNLGFNEWFCKNIAESHKENIFQYFFFDKFICLYENFFDLKNVKVLLFEQFLHEQNFFFAEIFDFLGIDDEERKALKNLVDGKHNNQTVTERQLKLRAIHKRFPFFSKLIPVWAKRKLIAKANDGKKVLVDLTKEQAEYIDRLYAKSNSELHFELGLNVEKYGYSVE